MRKLLRLTVFTNITICLVIALIMPNILANNYSINNQDIRFNNIQNIGFQIDQFQDNEGAFNMLLGNFNIAQSFKPNLTPLVKLDLFGYSIDDGKSLEVSIREFVNMQDLTSVVISSNDIPNQLSWFECDFPDIEVQPNKTYYIIINQVGGGQFIWYGNYQRDYYPRGYSYSNQENTQIWVNLSEIFQDLDFCFKTYSYGENQAPEAPIINGSINGRFDEYHDYEIYSLDPEGNEVLYRIDWGDQTISEWIGPYDSGEKVIITHRWEEKGDYIIKVQSKDIYGDKSEWSTLEVSMSRMISIIDNSPFFKIFNNLQNFILYLIDIC